MSKRVVYTQAAISRRTRDTTARSDLSSPQMSSLLVEEWSLTFQNALEIAAQERFSRGIENESSDLPQAFDYQDSSDNSSDTESSYQ